VNHLRRKYRVSGFLFAHNLHTTHYDKSLDVSI